MHGMSDADLVREALAGAREPIGELLRRHLAWAGALSAGPAALASALAACAASTDRLGRRCQHGMSLPRVAWHLP